MASSSKQRIRSYVAGGTIPAYSFVKLQSSSPGTTKNPVVISCTSGRALGISQNQASLAAGSQVEVALPGGGAMLTLGGTVNVNESIKPTTAGAGIATTAAGDYAGAAASEGGVSGDIIAVEVIRDQKFSADAV